MYKASGKNRPNTIGPDALQKWPGLCKCGLVASHKVFNQSTADLTCKTFSSDAHLDASEIHTAPSFWACLFVAMLSGAENELKERPKMFVGVSRLWHFVNRDYDLLAIVRVMCFPPLLRA